ncbi:MAG: enoyl-CoA hydratase/isomerase family protein [Deltaproteobacteria bacterium]|nr:enoyl-CoA hydratase/isomerase family protein [Deltaproteobacteria bacterium]
MVVILSSTTPGVFSAGADLKLTIPLLNGNRSPENDFDHTVLNDLDLYRKGTLKTCSTDRPIIAAIDGFCFAAGFEAVMGTDIRISTERSLFALPEVSRGIVVWGGGTSKLARQIPYARAMEMNLTGRRFSAREMLGFGFLNEVVAEDDLMDKAEAYARQIVTNAPLAVRAAKSSIIKCLGHPIDQVLDIELEATKHIRPTEDAKEGPRAFAEKRLPLWRAQ